MTDLPTSFAAPTFIPPIQGNQAARVTYGADDALAVRFYKRAVHMGALSDAAGRPIYEERIYIEIVIPSDTQTKSIIDREASEDDKRRFHRHWAAFEGGNERPVIGTPLEVWPQLDVAMVAMLKHSSVHTVEQLAALSDIQLTPLQPHGLALRQQAQGFLEAAKDGALVSKLEAVNADLQAQLDDMRKQIDMLTKPKAKEIR